MISREDFGRFVCVREQSIKDEPSLKKMEIDEFYEASREQLPEMARRLGGANAPLHKVLGLYLTVKTGELWEMTGRPYFKVYPSLMRMMGETRCDVSGSSLHLPYPAFELRFPNVAGHELRSNHGVIESALVSFWDRSKLLSQRSMDLGDNKDMLGISYQINSDEGWKGDCHITLEISDDCTIEESLQNAFAHRVDTEMDITTEEEVVERLARIVVCCCFFGVDGHEMIMPDFTRKQIVKFQKAKASGDQAKMDEITALAGRGYTLGKEIDLPTPEVINAGPRRTGEPIRELNHGYLRRGHLRRQQKGPRDNPYHEIVFVHPHLVRPDLPQREVQAFAIGREFEASR